jgi:hypothetical protein
MKGLRHPATIIASLALFVALGGTSLAAASYINGKHIEPHSIPRNRLMTAAIKSLKGDRGLKGLPGKKGDEGPVGPSNGYFSSSNNTLATLSLPAGDYMLYGWAYYSNPNSAGQNQTGCSLEVMGPGTVTTTLGGAGATVPINNGEAMVSDQGVAHLPAASQILNNCYYTSSGTSAQTAVTAIKVSSVTP